MKPIREVKLASAGTGKTFSLSNIFLHLYTQGVELDAILASTFTRKAAAEILKRLFERLVEGVNNPDKLDELKRHDAIPKTWARDDAKLCAIRLGQSINKIQVLTLDSYFNGIATQFRSELELPLQWGLSNEQQELAMLQQAIVEHISTLNLDEFAIEASILTGKGAPRDFLETLSKASRSLLNFIKDSHPDAWDCIDAKTCDTTPED
ncbi:MAG: UvrD-helicase domain-containing protein, partial [Planctomycetota bacterium]|nr:UvrD-helicase domain-containing protein [Planctomycetota bacterium]